MNNWLIYSVGFLAQIFFGARLISQWVLSEKAKQVQTPTSYWRLSLFASILMFVYGYLRQDLAIMIGQILIYMVYIRNLQLQDQWKNSNTPIRLIAILSPIVIAFYLVFISNLNWVGLLKGANISSRLVAFGILGHLVFHGRFIYQWAYSEKNKRSSLPLGFWFISLTGALLIFVYALFRKDPVLLASHFLGMIVYLRNLYLLRNPVESVV